MTKQQIAAMNYIALRDRDGLNDEEVAYRLKWNPFRLGAISSGSSGMIDEEIRILADFFGITVDNFLSMETNRILNEIKSSPEPEIAKEVSVSEEVLPFCNKYFYDTEFIEGCQTRRFLGMEFPFIKTKPTIDLISIGMVSEDGRELHLISNEFNLKEAWNRFEDGEYWLRENVLKPIFYELSFAFKTEDNYKGLVDMDFDYDTMKFLIQHYGKTNKEIAKIIIEFCTGENIKLYGYYSAYDHVVLSWLFGKMADLPKGFPMYTIDVQQMYDTFEKELSPEIQDAEKLLRSETHNSLGDAKFVKRLYQSINQLLNNKTIK